MGSSQSMAKALVFVMVALVVAEVAAEIEELGSNDAASAEIQIQKNADEAQDEDDLGAAVRVQRRATLSTSGSFTLSAGIAVDKMEEELGEASSSEGFKCGPWQRQLTYGKKKKTTISKNCHVLARSCQKMPAKKGRGDANCMGMEFKTETNFLGLAEPPKSKVKKTTAETQQSLKICKSEYFKFARYNEVIGVHKTYASYERCMQSGKL